MNHYIISSRTILIEIDLLCLSIDTTSEFVSYQFSYLNGFTAILLFKQNFHNDYDKLVPNLLFRWAFVFCGLFLK